MSIKLLQKKWHFPADKDLRNKWNVHRAMHLVLQRNNLCKWCWLPQSITYLLCNCLKHPSIKISQLQRGRTAGINEQSRHPRVRQAGPAPMSRSGDVHSNDRWSAQIAMCLASHFKTRTKIYMATWLACHSERRIMNQTVQQFNHREKTRKLSELFAWLTWWILFHDYGA